MPTSRLRLLQSLSGVCCRRAHSAVGALSMGRQYKRRARHRAEMRLRPRPSRATIAGVEPVLMTERLVLRRFTAADVDGLLALDGDPAVMRFLDSQLKSRAEIEAEVLPRFLGYYQRPGAPRLRRVGRDGGRG